MVEKVINLLNSIEKLRKELYLMSRQARDLSDNKMISKSQELDKLLTKYNKLLLK